MNQVVIMIIISTLLFIMFFSVISIYLYNLQKAIKQVQEDNNKIIKNCIDIINRLEYIQIENLASIHNEVKAACDFTKQNIANTDRNFDNEIKPIKESILELKNLYMNKNIENTQKSVKQPKKVQKTLSNEDKLPKRRIYTKPQ